MKSKVMQYAYYTGEQAMALVKEAVEEEQERVRSHLLKRHEESKHNHNYYHCLEVELFESKPV